MSYASHRASLTIITAFRDGAFGYHLESRMVAEAGVLLYRNLPLKRGVMRSRVAAPVITPLNRGKNEFAVHF
jgi:hypothetical protein